MNSMQERIERLAIEQAVYNAIGADLKTGVYDNLRGEVNEHYRELYDQTGATGFEVRVNGAKVGTYGFNRVKGKPAYTERIAIVTDVDALRASEDDDWLDWCGRYIDSHIEELAIQYVEETGELLDGMSIVEREHPATPDTILPNGTLRIRADKVADALGNALPATIAGLLGGA